MVSLCANFGGGLIVIKRKTTMSERVKDALSGRYGPVFATLLVQIVVIGFLIPWVKDVNLTLDRHSQILATAPKDLENVKLSVEKAVWEKLEVTMNKVHERIQAAESLRSRELEILRDKFDNLRVAVSESKLSTDMLGRQMQDFTTRVSDLKAEFKQAMIDNDQRNANKP